MSAAAAKVVQQWGIKSATPRVNTIVFTSPTTATVEYDLVASPYSFDGRIGNAVLDQGVWKVTAATACKDISLGGASC